MAFVSPHNRLCGPPSTQRVVDALRQQHNTNTVGVLFELGEFFGGLRSTTIRHFVTTIRWYRLFTTQNKHELTSTRTIYIFYIYTFGIGRLLYVPFVCSGMGLILFFVAPVYIYILYYFWICYRFTVFPASRSPDDHGHTTISGSDPVHYRFSSGSVVRRLSWW